MNSDNLKNNLNEREILPADEQKVCDLIGRLDRVECPKNFDFRLKARIASADKNEYQPSVRQTLRYVLPVAASVLIVAFVMVQAGMFSPANQTGNVITSATNPNIQPFDGKSKETQISTVSNSIAPDMAAVSNQNNQMNALQNMDVSLTNSSESRVSLPKLSREDNSTMSKDFGVRPNRKSLYPNGINPEQIKPRMPENQDNKSISIKDAFDFIGMQTEVSGGKLKVKSVRENTMADKSGIKVGDVIEAIDDAKIAPNETMMKSNSVRKITVLRGGKFLEISLQP